MLPGRAPLHDVSNDLNFPAMDYAIQYFTFQMCNLFLEIGYHISFVQNVVAECVND